MFNFLGGFFIRISTLFYSISSINHAAWFCNWQDRKQRAEKRERRNTTGSFVTFWPSSADPPSKICQKDDEKVDDDQGERVASMQMA